jgi:hypothetical protein
VRLSQNRLHLGEKEGYGPDFACSTRTLNCKNYIASFEFGRIWLFVQLWASDWYG